MGDNWQMHWVGDGRGGTFQGNDNNNGSVAFFFVILPLRHIHTRDELEFVPN